jgi:Uma2 family endonuclease
MMSRMNTTTTTPDLAPPLLPGFGLENGDRMTREEFHRRYEAMPHLSKAELIEGVVHIPSPVRYRRRGAPQFNMIWWLGCYVAVTPGVEGGDNATLKLDLMKEPQPDAFLIVTPECGGQVRLDQDDYIVGAPELVGEVSASSVSIDLHDKLAAYRRNQVKEFMVWRVLDKVIDWFVLRNDRYERVQPAADGFSRAKRYPACGSIHKR